MVSDPNPTANTAPKRPLASAHHKRRMGRRPERSAGTPWGHGKLGSGPCPGAARQRGPDRDRRAGFAVGLSRRIGLAEGDLVL